MPLLKIFKLLLRFWNSVGMGLPVFGDPLLVSFFGIWEVGSEKNVEGYFASSWDYGWR